MISLLLVSVLLFFPASRSGAEELDGELVLRSYQHTYPEKTGEVIFQNGDWTILAGNETFYWAGGRLLPFSLLEKADEWIPHSFSVYPQNVPSPEIYSDEFIEALRNEGRAEDLFEDEAYPGFQAALYGGLTRREIESRLKQTEFLGKKIVVHEDIIAALGRIDKSLRENARHDRELAAFIDSIGQEGAYNWREIRGTHRMSYHSWGLAVDIQPKNLGGKAIYWMWERFRNDDWMIVPLRQRWKPPEQVISAFEREGFVWGGKWALYDNMHFEYRPELHEINRIIAAEGAKIPAINTASKNGVKQDLHHLYPAMGKEKIHWHRSLIRIFTK